MVGVFDLWLPIILSAVFVFIVSGGHIGGSSGQKSNGEQGRKKCLHVEFRVPRGSETRKD